MGEIKTLSETQNYYALEPEAVLAALNSKLEGLSQDEARARLEIHGPNELAQGQKISPVIIFVRQFLNLLMIILIIATGVSFLLGEHLDAWVILAIILACVILGFFQEYRAEKAAAALQQLAAPHATVLREDEELVVPAREVVPGDILLIHTGDRVAADARLLEVVNLMVDEAILTGESTPVDQVRGAVAGAGHSHRRPAWYGLWRHRGNLRPRTCRGHHHRHGHRIWPHRPNAGRGAGRKNPFGKADIPDRSGPQYHLSGAWLPVPFYWAFIKGIGWLPMLIWGISLAVAAVPESLPAVVTGALSIGTTRMARRQAIVKRLPAVETMGCTTVICTDKTGTLTKNEMTVRDLYMDERLVHITGSGYEPQGDFHSADHEQLSLTNPVLHAAARISLLCNDASLKEEGGKWLLRGDPTEGALLTLGLKAGLDYSRLLQEYPRVAEIPFDSERKRMSTLHQDRSGLLMCLKGAPESLLPFCSRRLTSQGEKPLTESHYEAILAGKLPSGRVGHAGAGSGLPSPGGVAGIDPRLGRNRPGLGGSGGHDRSSRARKPGKPWHLCHRAGINVIMVTGDHPETAAAIGHDLGLSKKPDHAASGAHRLGKSVK